MLIQLRPIQTSTQTTTPIAVPVLSGTRRAVPPTRLAGESAAVLDLTAIPQATVPGRPAVIHSRWHSTSGWPSPDRSAQSKRSNAC